MPNPTPWTDAHIETLRAMWASGEQCRAIADALGAPFTRNSVIGKAHRLGLAGRPNPVQPRDPNAPPRKRVRVSRLKPRMTVEQMRRHTKGDAGAYRTCQWIDGDPKRKHSYCGAASITGHSWCGHHYDRVYLPPGVKNVG